MLQSSSAVFWGQVQGREGKKKKRITKGHKETSGGDGYVYHLDYGYVFTGRSYHTVHFKVAIYCMSIIHQ